MTLIDTRKVGKSSAVVTELGLGCAPIGNLFENLSEQACQSTFEAAWDAGIRFYDTAPYYGHGISEHRLGNFLRQKPRDEFVVSTKVGRVLTPTRDPANFDGTPWAAPLPFDWRFDYSYDGIMRSYEDSLQRLGLPSVDMLLIHDLDFWFNQTEIKVNAYLSELFTSGFRALEELRSSGAIKAIGAGINEMGMMPRFLDLVDVDFFIVALPYTLLDQDVLDAEFPRCEEMGVGADIGALFEQPSRNMGSYESSTARYEISFHGLYRPRRGPLPSIHCPPRPVSSIAAPRSSRGGRVECPSRGGSRPGAPERSAFRPRASDSSRGSGAQRHGTGPRPGPAPCPPSPWPTRSPESA